MWQVWWDVFDDRISLAFVRESPPDLNWDVELSLLGCGLPMRGRRVGKAPSILAP